MEKNLLYYDGFQKMPRHWNGESIHQLYFTDIKTDEDISFLLCNYAQELSVALGKNVYSSIDELENDFDILWDKKESTLSPLKEEFSDVQAEYSRMMNQGVPIEDINAAMLKQYKVSVPSRT